MPQPVVDSRSSIATDPLRNFRFIVKIPHDPAGAVNKSLVTLGFMNCAGLNVETSVIAYRQGGMNTTPQKMPGQSEFTPITLSRGVMVKTPQAFGWYQEIFSVIQGGGFYAPTKGKDFRTNIDIMVLAHPYTRDNNVPVKLRFKVFNAWPQSLGYSDLDAGGNAVMMEQMVLQHEGWKVTYATDPYSSEAALIS